MLCNARKHSFKGKGGLNRVQAERNKLVVQEIHEVCPE